MISPERFYRHLQAQGIDFFTGVPDSLLKDLLKYFQENIDSPRHIITANEGLAVALATGYHLSTGELPLLYLQNSGLGNMVNPLTSLTDKEIYSIPMLMLVGWRGMPGKTDEPQHKKMGRITEQLLNILEIPYFILQKEENISLELVSTAINMAKDTQQPVALLVPDELFEKYTGLSPSLQAYTLSREQVLEKLYGYFAGNETVLCTTGKTGREFYELNRKYGGLIKREFLCVGGMGLANHIALGIDLKSHGRIVMLDGDGALLMHLGSLAAIGMYAKNSFVHIVINNGSHESVGGQPTAGFHVDFCLMAKAGGYTKTFCITNETELMDWLQYNYNIQEKQFVEIRIKASSRNNLGRPVGTPVQWKKELMDALRQQLVIEEGAIKEIKNILLKAGIENVFIVMGEHFKNQEAVQEYLPLPDFFKQYSYIKKGVNVTREETEGCYNDFIASDARAIIAIGGGSVIDLAKAVIYKNYYTKLKSNPFFIAVPTTAGSGSEATCFAVVYEDTIKTSLEHEALLPAAVILDSSLGFSLTPRQTAVSGIDALAQAIESYWNIYATAESEKYAEEAISILIENLPSAVVNPTADSRKKVLWAAHLAGKAINITHTTAPHALSYFLTANYGIPHGQAVALFLPAFFLYNAAVNDKNCNHPEGAGKVKVILKQLCALLRVPGSDEAADLLHSFIKNIGLATTLHELGIEGDDIAELIVEEINEQRFNNNPVMLDRLALIDLCRKHL